MNDAFALINRPDTFLGVCEGIGTDLGINPNWLRLAWAVPLFLNPLYAAAGYLTLAALVVAVRWLMPARKATRVDRSIEPVIQSSETDLAEIEYAIAA